jgi:hypothetical protein
MFMSTIDTISVPVFPRKGNAVVTFAIDTLQFRDAAPGGRSIGAHRSDAPYRQTTDASRLGRAVLGETS